MQQAIDFREESDALYQLLEPITAEDFQQKTQFKNWTINDVLGHLHMWNWAADVSLNDNKAFEEFLTSLITDLANGSLRDFEKKWLKGLIGKELLREWHTFYTEMSKRFEAADPKTRVKWAGPDMSVRSSITARLMETWAHGQEVYDHLGVVRDNKDRIKNIAVLGINTFGWTFMNRGLNVPENKPYVKLTAPSGEIWEWNDPSTENRVEGAAEDFCQIVTQVRGIGDTSLKVVGETATQWMSIAQCFAGPAETPPKPGTRFTR
ncbi:TIGR03084 family protein [bacterium]|nr:TIGR03084 family protein [bacterium]